MLVTITDRVTPVPKILGFAQGEFIRSTKVPHHLLKIGTRGNLSLDIKSKPGGFLHSYIAPYEAVLWGHQRSATY